jgi:hypothetical protein
VGRIHLDQYGFKLRAFVNTIIGLSKFHKRRGVSWLPQDTLYCMQLVVNCLRSNIIGEMCNSVVSAYCRPSLKSRWRNRSNFQMGKLFLFFFLELLYLWGRRGLCTNNILVVEDFHHTETNGHSFVFPATCVLYIYVDSVSVIFTVTL